MSNAMMSFLSTLARRLVPRRRRPVRITCSAFMPNRPLFPCGAGCRDVAVDSVFVKPKALRKVKPRRIGEKRKRARDGSGDLVVDDGDAPCVWRRTILLGRRCQPLDFTGAIHYDCEGQRLWQPRTPTPLMSPVRSSELRLGGYMDRA